MGRGFTAPCPSPGIALRIRLLSFFGVVVAFVIAVGLAFTVPNTAKVGALTDPKVGVVAFTGHEKLRLALDRLSLLGDQVCRGCKSHTGGKTEHDAFQMDAIHRLFSL